MASPRNAAVHCFSWATGFPGPASRPACEEKLRAVDGRTGCRQRRTPSRSAAPPCPMPRRSRPCSARSATRPSRQRWQRDSTRLLASARDAVLVAAEGEGEALLGVLALHWSTLLHLATPIARIGSLVVAEGARGRGVGALLLQEAAALAKAEGCAGAGTDHRDAPPRRPRLLRRARLHLDLAGLRPQAGRGRTRVTTTIYVDGDACPVRAEVFRVSARLGLPVRVVSNGSRPARPPDLPLVETVVVEAGADAADDWIAERISRGDMCVTADIPLAARCLERGARALSPKGQALDHGQHRRRARRAGGGARPAGGRPRHRWPGPTHPRRPLPLPVRPRRRRRRRRPGPGGAAGPALGAVRVGRVGPKSSLPRNGRAKMREPTPALGLLSEGAHRRAQAT